MGQTTSDQVLSGPGGCDEMYGPQKRFESLKINFDDLPNREKFIFPTDMKIVEAPWKYIDDEPILLKEIPVKNSVFKLKSFSDPLPKCQVCGKGPILGKICGEKDCTIKFVKRLPPEEKEKWTICEKHGFPHLKSGGCLLCQSENGGLFSLNMASNQKTEKEAKADHKKSDDDGAEEITQNEPGHKKILTDNEKDHGDKLSNSLHEKNETDEKTELIQTDEQNENETENLKSNDLEKDKLTHEGPGSEIEKQSGTDSEYHGPMNDSLGQSNKEKNCKSQLKEVGSDPAINQSVLFSSTGQGKSPIGNRILDDDSENADQILKASPLEKACTQSIRHESTTCQVGDEKQRLCVIDAPGCGESQEADRMHAKNVVQSNANPECTPADRVNFKPDCQPRENQFNERSTDLKVFDRLGRLSQSQPARSEKTGLIPIVKGNDNEREKLNTDDLKKAKLAHRGVFSEFETQSRPAIASHEPMNDSFDRLNTEKKSKAKREEVGSDQGITRSFSSLSTEQGKYTVGDRSSGDFNQRQCVIDTLGCDESEVDNGRQADHLVNRLNSQREYRINERFTEFNVSVRQGRPGICSAAQNDSDHEEDQKTEMTLID